MFCVVLCGGIQAEDRSAPSPIGSKAVSARVDYMKFLSPLSVIAPCAAVPESKAGENDFIQWRTICRLIHCDWIHTQCAQGVSVISLIHCEFFDSSFVQALDRLEGTLEPRVYWIGNVLGIVTLFMIALSVVEWQYSKSLSSLESWAMYCVHAEGERAYSYEVSLFLSRTVSIIVPVLHRRLRPMEFMYCATDTGHISLYRLFTVVCSILKTAHVYFNDLNLTRNAKSYRTIPSTLLSPRQSPCLPHVTGA